MFNSILNANMLRFFKKHEGEYIETFRDVGELKEFYSGQYIVSMTNIGSSLFIALMIGVMQIYAVIVPLAAILLIGVIYYIRDTRLNDVLIEQRQAESEANSQFIQVIKSMDTVKGTAMEPLIENIMRPSFEYREKLNFKITSVSAKTDNLAQYIRSMALILQVVICGSFVIDGDLTQGALAAIVILMNRLMPPVQQSFAFLSRFRKHKVYKQEVLDIFNLKEVESDQTHFNPNFSLNINVNTKKNEQKNNRQYNLKPNSITVVTGRNGSGKSLLLSSLADRRNSDTHQFSIDGIDVENVNLEQWPAATTFINADSDFVNASIIENLTCFRSELNHMALAICDAFGVKNKINRLEKGFYTPIENGLRSSVPLCLAYRLLIVQAIVNNTHLIILDELANFSDTESLQLLEVIRTFSSKNIFLIASHSQAIINAADTIISLDEE
jgi:ABC-type bacteriocin/lantibiotic exporter with double-glycine peptidase domain